jgi:hypothetical protein
MITSSVSPKFVPKSENCGFPPHYMEWSEEPITKEPPKRNKKSNYVESIIEECGKEEYESDDKYFKTFQKKMRQSPAHCLRVGGSPIWMREDKKFNQKVPNCSVCGKIRAYEFQIMSPLIYFMKPLNSKFELSYGVVTIFGCPENCVDRRKNNNNNNDSHHFIEEFYIKQDD